MPETPPSPVIRTYSQLINQDFVGGQAHILRLRDFVRSVFFSGAVGAGNENEINLKEFPGYDPGGVNATNDTALTAAWAKMIERGRSRVIVPPGSYRFSNPITLERAFSSAGRAALVGAGPGVTNFTNTNPAANVFNIGSLSAQTGNLAFRNFSVTVTGTGSSTGYAFSLERCREVEFDNIFLNACANGWNFGPTTTDPAQRCIEVYLKNCSGSLRSGAGSNWINIVAGELIFIEGGTTTGRVDQRFINHESSVGNTDGLYIFGHKSAQWGWGIRSVGDGIGNLRMDCHQFDRAIHFIECAGTPGSHNVNWQVRSQFQGQGAGATSADAAMVFDASDGIIEAITIYGSSFIDRQGPVAEFIGNAAPDRGPYVSFVGNTIRNCGQGGTPIFVIDANSNPSFYSNHISHSVDVAASDYTYGFDYAGASTGRRNDPTDVNTILDFATGAVNGTP